MRTNTRSVPITVTAHVAVVAEQTISVLRETFSNDLVPESTRIAGIAVGAFPFAKGFALVHAVVKNVVDAQEVESVFGAALALAAVGVYEKFAEFSVTLG